MHFICIISHHLIKQFRSSFSIMSVAGRLPPSELNKPREGILSRILTVFLAFFMTFFALVRSITCHVKQKLHDSLPESDHEYPVVMLNPVPEELCTPSPSPRFTDVDLPFSVLKRLAELEEKVETLQTKPSEMPTEKEELLNAAVCRVDALEAELIATKKPRNQVHEDSSTRNQVMLAMICRFSMLRTYRATVKSTTGESRELQE